MKGNWETPARTHTHKNRSQTLIDCMYLAKRAITSTLSLSRLYAVLHSCTLDFLWFFFLFWFYFRHSASLSVKLMTNLYMSVRVLIGASWLNWTNRNGKTHFCTELHVFNIHFTIDKLTEAHFYPIVDCFTFFFVCVCGSVDLLCIHYA